jgi:uracil-DNA glycosylase family 4
MIGRNPGYEEDISGLPFQGPLSDRFWSAWLPGSSLPSLATLFLTNIARCFHVDGQSPKPAVFSLCRQHLIPDIQSINSMGGGPIFLLTMGAEATTHAYALAGHRGITLTKAFSRQGFKTSIANIPVLIHSTFHPAFCEREERHIYAVQDHLRLLTDALQGLRPIPSTPSFHPIRSPRPCPSSPPS